MLWVLFSLLKKADFLGYQSFTRGGGKNGKVTLSIEWAVLAQASIL